MDQIEQLLQHDAEVLRSNADRYAALRPRPTATPSANRGARHRAATLTLVGCCAAALLVLLGWQYVSPPEGGMQRPAATGPVAAHNANDLVAFQQLTADTLTWAEGLAPKSRPAAPEVVSELRRQVREDRESVRRILLGLTQKGLTPSLRFGEGSERVKPSSADSKNQSGV